MADFNQDTPPVTDPANTPATNLPPADVPTDTPAPAEVPADTPPADTPSDDDDAVKSALADLIVALANDDVETAQAKFKDYLAIRAPELSGMNDDPSDTPSDTPADPADTPTDPDLDPTDPIDPPEDVPAEPKVKEGVMAPGGLYNAFIKRVQRLIKAKVGTDVEFKQIDDSNFEIVFGDGRSVKGWAGDDTVGLIGANGDDEEFELDSQFNSAVNAFANAAVQ